MTRKRPIPGGLIVSPPSNDPPALSNLQHWFDVTDASTVFSDSGGTTQATNGDAINNITNKGYDTANVASLNVVFGDQCRLLTNEINGLQVLEPTTLDAFGSIEPSSMGSSTGGATGITVAAVAQKIGTTTALGEGGWQNSHITSVPSPGWGCRHENLAAFDSGKSIIQDEWVWGYIASANNDHHFRVSGASEGTGTGAYTQMTSSENVNFFYEDTRFAELLIWDIKLDATQRSSLISYFDSKYGVLPV